jgi:Putative transposase of IS4/5 family (DUF4096)
MQWDGMPRDSSQATNTLQPSRSEGNPPTALSRTPPPVPPRFQAVGPIVGQSMGEKWWGGWGTVWRPSSTMYESDLSDAAWAIVEPQLPRAVPGGRRRSTDLRAVVNAIFYLLRTGCQWRLLPRDYPPRSTVYHYFSAWRGRGVWTQLQWESSNVRGSQRVAPLAQRWSS